MRNHSLTNISRCLETRSVSEDNVNCRVVLAYASGFPLLVLFQAVEIITASKRERP